MIRVIATGDNHFDQHSRWDEALRVHAWIADLVERERPDAFLVGGDIYERASTPLERDAVASWLIRVAEVCPVVIAKGNHDRPQDLALLARLATRHPIVVEERADIHYVAGIAIATVAWPSRASLLAAIDSTDSAVASATERVALEAVLRGFAGELAAHAGPSVLLGHFMVDGSVTSTGQPLQGHAMNVSLSDLALAGADITLMSHVHAAQEWVLPDGGEALYMGSPFRTSFGELEAKSVTLVEWPRGVAEDRPAWRRIETPATPMLHVAASLVDADCMETGASMRALEIVGDYPNVAGAEVRLRYSVPSDERELGRAQASAWKATFLREGAVHAKVEELVIPVVRARAPEVAQATSLADKLRAMWVRRLDETTDVDRTDALLAKAARLEEEHGIGRDVHAGGAPRFERIRARGIGPFTEVDIDLASIPGLLVAVTGRNGAGKSTLLNLLPGSLYRDTAQGSLASLARTRDALVEVRVVNGASHVVRHLLDAVSGKGESLAMDDAGHPLTNAAQRREYDSWAEGHFPPPEVLYASTFAAQQAGTFVEMKPGKRKEVLLRALGVERLEALAELAREHARAAKQAVATLEARLADERARALPLDEAHVAVDQLALEHEAATGDLEDARRRVAETSEALSLYTRTVERRVELNTGLVKHERSRDAARDRADVARELAARAPEIAAARARVAELEARLEVERASHAAAVRALEEAERALHEARRAEGDLAIVSERLDALRGQLTSTTGRLEALRPIIARTAEIRAAQARLPGLDEELERARAAHDTAKAGRETASGEWKANQVAVGEARRRAGEIAEAVKRLEYKVRDEVRVRAAADEQRALDAAVVALRAEHARVQDAIDAEGAAGLTSKDERIDALRDGLSDIEQGVSDEQARARAALDTDDVAEMRDAERPERVATLRRRLNELAVEIDTSERRSREVARTAAQLDGIVAALAELATARASLVAADAEEAERDAALKRSEDRGWETRRALDEAAATEKRAKADRDAAAALAAEAEALTGAETERAALEERVVEITAQQATDRDTHKSLSATTPMSASLREACDAARRAADDASRTALDTQRAIQDARETLRSADDVARASADLEAAIRDVELAEAEIAALRAALAALPSTTTRPDVEAARQAEAAATSRAKTAVEQLTRAQAAYEASQASAAKRAELERDLHAERAESSDWERLSRDLGKDGIQALEIDAAGPELTAIANDLLHACVSRRWTIAIHTQRLNHDGKKMIEGCEVEITDVEAGRVGAAETFSGGERVLIGEAVSLALSVLACRRAGVEGCTLVRDESGAALDAANGRAYVAMLRRAAAQIGARQVLYVSHSPELQELADARIHIEGGTAQVIA